MKTITRKELNEWKKQFHVGDKVKVTYEGEFYGLTGVVTRKNSYIYVKMENGKEIGLRSSLEVIEKFVKPIKEKVKSYKLSRPSKLDFFEETKKQVSKVLSRHNIDIEYTDDDTFHDWIYGTDLHSFEIHELQCIFSYNAMLQTLAFNPDLIDITLNFDHK